MSVLKHLLQMLGERPHAYQPGILEFLTLDLDKVKRDLRLAEIGTQRGREGIPGPECDTLDDVEREIERFVEAEKRRWHQQFLDQLATYDQRLAALNLENRIAQLTATAERAITDFKAN